jgi:hypothetical protein
VAALAFALPVALEGDLLAVVRVAFLAVVPAARAVLPRAAPRVRVVEEDDLREPAVRLEFVVDFFFVVAIELSEYLWINA